MLNMSESFCWNLSDLTPNNCLYIALSINDWNLINDSNLNSNSEIKNINGWMIATIVLIISLACICVLGFCDCSFTSPSQSNSYELYTKNSINDRR